jgi:phospholipase A1
VLVVCASSTAAAQRPPASYSECHAIESSSERLACYDAATGRPAAKPAAAADEAAQPKQALATATAPSPARASMIDAAWDFDPSTPRLTLGFYRPNYFLAARYSDRPNDQPFTPLFAASGVPPQNLDDVEAKFQISAKARVWASDDRRFGVWFAYTQQNQWQVYNDEGIASRPFRETNYQPEVFVSYRPGIELPGGFSWKLLNAGYTHQSNGRAQFLSRSWDRLFAEVGFERENLVLSARAWYRIEERSDKDDNPDITDFLGHAEINALYRWRGHSFQLGARGNLGTGKGAVQFGWTTPPILGPFRGYVQLFSGYGESLIDYNWKQTTIGAGVALSDGL